MAALREVARPIGEDRQAAVRDLAGVVASIVLLAGGLLVAFWLVGVRLPL